MKLALALAVLAFVRTGTVLRVELVDQQSGRPIEGALVSVLAADGATVTQRISDAHGIDVFDLTTPGQYKVLVRRIGFVPFTSEPVSVGSGDTTRLKLPLASIPVAMPQVTTTAPAKACKRGDPTAQEAALLLGQIRVALEATQMTAHDTSSRTIQHDFNVERWIDRGGNVRSGSQVLTGFTPFVGKSPADLSKLGYVVVNADGQPSYGAPDARALLSPEFESDHCFSLVAGTGGTAGLTGLSFRPVADRSQSDIQGTLWVTSRTARLQYLDYEYVNYRPPHAADAATGRVIFERLAGGAWVVSDWMIRTPHFIMQPDERGRPISLLAFYGDVSGSSEPVTAGVVMLSRATSTEAVGGTFVAGTPGGTGRQAAVATGLSTGAGLARPCSENEVSSALTVMDSGVRNGGRPIPVPGAVVAVYSFEAAQSGMGVRREVGTAQAGMADNTGSVHICIARDAGQPVAIAYSDRATSAPVAIDVDSPPAPSRLLVDQAGAINIDLAKGGSGFDLTIRDASGAPIEGAIVATKGRTSSETSNRFGKVSVRKLAAGFAVLDIWRAGYRRQRVLLELPAKKTQAFEVRLVPEERDDGGRPSESSAAMKSRHSR